MRSGLCSACGVHRNICVCDQCRPVTGAPPIWLLQDPLEQGHSKGTARIVEACLPNSRRLVVKDNNDLTPLRQQTPRSLGVLFPTQDSRPLEEAVSGDIRQWIILDGTWRKALKLFLSQPFLQSLPQFHFDQPTPSRYRIRKAPQAGQLATAEAVIQLLREVAPGCNTGPMQQAMDALVERQLAQMPPEVRERYE